MPRLKMDDIKLLELVKENGLLYDKNHSDYNDAAKRNLTWNGIAAALGSTVEDCRRRFRSLRDRFTKEKRARKAEMLHDPTLPLLYKKMLFLWDHLLHRGPSATPRVKKVKSSQNSDVEAQNHIVEESSRTCDDESQHSTEELGESCRTSTAVVPQDASIPTVNSLSEKGQIKRQKPNDEHFAAFAKYMKENRVDAGICTSEQQNPTKKLRPNDDHFAVFAQYMKENGVDTGICTSQYMKENGAEANSSDSSLPCNEAFCAVVKDYLDQINNPMKLSVLRIQILTILHNELFKNS